MTAAAIKRFGLLALAGLALAWLLSAYADPIMALALDARAFCF